MVSLREIRAFLKSIDAKIPTLEQLDSRYAKRVGAINIAPALVVEGEVSGPYEILDT